MGQLLNSHDTKDIVFSQIVNDFKNLTNPLLNRATIPNLSLLHDDKSHIPMGFKTIHRELLFALLRIHSYFSILLTFSKL